jgi:5-formyltetrahydrofolate cyclo-ligase
VDRKSQARKEVKEELNLLPMEQHEMWSNQIAAKLYETSWWKDAAVIALTISRDREVSTMPLIERAWAAGKTVVVPKCNPTDHTMKFFRITSFSQLETVYFGLQEPIINETVYCSAEEIDLMVVPGIVFSKKGYRIGYGGGYYDRYLASFGGTAISLAFAFQLRKEVPADDHDIPVQAIITNEGITICDG